MGWHIARMGDLRNAYKILVTHFQTYMFLLLHITYHGHVWFLELLQMHAEHNVSCLFLQQRLGCVSFR
jgi:hypothetical protein